MIKRRNVVMVPILWLITLGIYGLVWFYQTSDELIRYNKKSDNPVLWLVLALIPGLNLIAIWFHAQAIEYMGTEVGKKGFNGILLFILWFVPIPFLVGMILSQWQLNKHAEAA